MTVRLIKKEIERYQSMNIFEAKSADENPVEDLFLPPPISTRAFPCPSSKTLKMFTKGSVSHQEQARETNQGTNFYYHPFPKQVLRV